MRSPPESFFALVRDIPHLFTPCPFRKSESEAGQELGHMPTQLLVFPRRDVRHSGIVSHGNSHSG
jgi:hypothetical protein